MNNQLTIFDSLIGRRVKMVETEGIIVMVEGLDVYIHKTFEKANKTPWSKREYVYTICHKFNDVIFLD